MSAARNFLSVLTGSFAMPAAENPTVAMVEAAYRHHGLDARYLNCEVPPAALGDAVRGARAMGWVGFNCSIPHKVAVVRHLDGLGSSAEVIGAATASSARTPTGRASWPRCERSSTRRGRRWWCSAPAGPRARSRSRPRSPAPPR
jgi:hypothetical protein